MRRAGEALQPRSFNLHGLWTLWFAPINYTDPTGHWAYPTGALKKAADSLRKKAAGGGSASSSSKSSASSGSEESGWDDLIGKFKAFVEGGSSSSGSSRSDGSDDHFGTIEDWFKGGGADSSISGLLPGYDIDPGFSIKSPFDSSYDPGFSMWNTDEIMEAIKKYGKSLKDAEPTAKGQVTSLKGSGGGSNGGRKIVYRDPYTGESRSRTINEYASPDNGAHIYWSLRELMALLRELGYYTSVDWKAAEGKAYTYIAHRNSDGSVTEYEISYYTDSAKNGELIPATIRECGGWKKNIPLMLYYEDDKAYIYLPDLVKTNQEGLSIMGSGYSGKLNGNTYTFWYDTPAPEPEPYRPDYSIEGLAKNLDWLSALAGEYGSNGSEYSANELVLQYIRKYRYDNSNWDIVAGKIDWNFINYVNDKTDILSAYFKTDMTIYDPYTGEGVDFVHLAATLNGLIYDTKYSDAGLRGRFGEDVIDDLCGWAGDLQTLTIDVITGTQYSNDYGTLYNKASELMGSSTSDFSMADLFADADAYNIYHTLNGNSLAESVRAYYRGGNQSRFHDFAGSNYTELGQRAAAYAYNGIVPYPLLEGYKVTENQAIAVGTAYADFVWNLRSKE